MDNEFLNLILNYHKDNRWQEILKLRQQSNNSSALKLLWVWPSEKNLTFIKKNVQAFGCRGIISIGCGCGLLEWIIHESTGLPTIGYEINREWWDSKYSSPHFIELNYPEEHRDNLLDPHCALLFCYFNDGSAFREYVLNYKGHLVIVIGPGDDVGRHTDPQPFKADFGSTEWVLQGYQEVKDTKDFIALYARPDQKQ